MFGDACAPLVSPSCNMAQLVLCYWRFLSLRPAMQLFNLPSCNLHLMHNKLKSISSKFYFRFFPAVSRRSLQAIVWVVLVGMFRFLYQISNAPVSSVN